MEDQRIKTLEDDILVLKNQVKAVLLDIKEQLATGCIVTQPAANAVVVQPASSPTENTSSPAAPQQAPSSGPSAQAVADPPAAEAPGSMPFAFESSAGFGSAPALMDSGPQMEPMSDSRNIAASAAAKLAASEGQMDLLTVSALSQWLSRAAVLVSKEQICKLIELYDITATLPSRTKQVLLLLADLCGKDNHVGDDPLPAAERVQLLIELDSLLRCRTGVLEPVVLSMLLDKSQNRRGC